VLFVDEPSRSKDLTLARGVVDTGQWNPLRHSSSHPKIVCQRQRGATTRART
jgi:hypothetical protein